MDLPADISFQLLSVDEAFTLAPDVLSASEKERFESFASPKRRLEFVAGRAAARLVIGRRLGCPPADIELCPSSDGAVDVVGHSELRLSITHAGDFAAAAVSEGPVGIDLEPIRSRHPELARFLLHEDEFDLLSRMEENRDEALVLLWTIKEAVLKARRSGFRFSPRKLRVDLDLPAGRAQVQVGDGERWAARFLERQGYYLSIAFIDLPAIGENQ